MQSSYSSPSSTKRLRFFDRGLIVREAAAELVYVLLDEGVRAFFDPEVGTIEARDGSVVRRWPIVTPSAANGSSGEDGIRTEESLCTSEIFGSRALAGTLGSESL